MLRYSLFVVGLISLMVSSCKDEDASPIVTQEKLLFGAFPRLITQSAEEFDIDNPSSTVYTMEVDFVDNAGGNDVSEYRLYVSFDDNSLGGGRKDYSTDSKLFRTYTPSDFRAGPNGNLGVEVSIALTEVANFVGVPIDSIRAGDRFRLRSEVEKADGRVFTNANSTSAITSAFDGIFDFDLNTTCPLDADEFSGEYTLEYGFVYNEFMFFGQPVQALGSPPLGRTVTLKPVSGSSTKRTFEIGTFLGPGTNGSPGGTITLDFACDKVTSTGATAASLTCGRGRVGSSQVGDASFDLNDDSTFTIVYEDFGSKDGGCKQEGLRYSLVFTKK